MYVLKKEVRICKIIYMCGIVGYIGQDTLNKNDIKILMLANMWRGTDASGFFTPETGIIKNNKQIDNFLAEHSDEIPDTNIFIGHVRKATFQYSSKSADKAHPFMYENIVGVHNGTLTNHIYMKGNKYSDLKLSTDYIDSELLIAGLSEGIDVLKFYEGAVATIWYDTNTPDTIYFYHDKERPLFRGTKSSVNGIYLSSTEESLKIIGCEKIVSVNELIVYTATIDGLIPSKCKQIKRSPLTYKATTYTESEKPNMLLSVFDGMKYFNFIDSWYNIHEDKSLFSVYGDEGTDSNNMVLLVSSIRDSDYKIVWSPDLQSFSYINDNALEKIVLSKGMICRVMQPDSWNLEDNSIVLIRDIISAESGIVYDCLLWETKIDSDKISICSTSKRAHYLGIELLPIINKKPYSIAINYINKFTNDE